MIAFHLIAKTLKVKRAQHLKQYLDEHPSYFTGFAAAHSTTGAFWNPN